MQRIHASLLPLLAASALTAQSPIQGSASWGSPAVDEGIDIHTDAQGYTYICGYFSGKGDFDPHPQRIAELAQPNGGDVFVQKFDPQGNLLWVRTWSSPGWDAGYAITTDARQHVFVVIKTKEKNQETLRLAQWSPAGELRWVKSYLHTERLEIGDLQVANNQLFLSFSQLSQTEREPSSHGIFVLHPESGQLQTEPQLLQRGEHLLATTENTLYCFEGTQLVAYQLDAMKELWAKPASSASRIATDPAGNLLVAGKTLLGDFYLEKRDAASGAVLWHQSIESAKRISGLACSHQQIFLSIKTKDTEIALLQYDIDGNFQGMQRIPHTESSDIYNLSAHPQGGVAATGYFSQTMGNGLLRPTGSAGANDAFWLRWQGASAQAKNVVSTETQAVSDLALDAQLLPCFPNPASQQTTIVFVVPSPQAVYLHLYDATGRLLRTVFQGEAQGEMQVLVELSDLPAGVYFYQLQWNKGQLIQQLIVK